MVQIGPQSPANLYLNGQKSPPAVYRGSDQGQDKHTILDSFWSSVNHLATKPVQYYFSHGSNNVKMSQADQKLGQFGAEDAKEILAHAQPGDIILWGSKDSFVHGSV